MEKSNQTCVSAASASESDNFEINDFGYFLFLKASLPRQIRFESVFDKHFTIMSL